MSKRKNRTSDSISIKDVLSGSIGEVIERLQTLMAEYPKGEIEVTADYEYGESYAAAYLRFERDKTSLEIECEEWKAKADKLSAMKKENSAFERNKTPYPRAEEMEALRKELGFFAMAPMDATIMIHDGEVLVYDMRRGARRRDGTFVLRMMMGGNEQMEKWFEEMDKEYT